MMTRMTAVGPEALSRRERISSGLSSVIRDSSSKISNTSRREKLLGISPPISSASPLSNDSDGELKEEDIWAFDDSTEDPPQPPQPPQPTLDDQPRFLGRHWLGLAESKEPSPLGLSSINRPSANAAVRECKPATAARMIIPQVSSAFDSSKSAPVNIPDWSKILGIDKRSNKENGFGFQSTAADGDGDGDGDGDDEGQEKLPPHELIARDYAKSHTAFSVYEGAGRTLKGMDLSRVRNAVWKQTGFLGG